MNLLFWGLTIGIVGKIMLGVGVIVAHSQLVHERKIDQAVLRSFRTEHILTITGIFLMAAGYLMELYFYGLLSLLTCFSDQCLFGATAILSQ